MKVQIKWLHLSLLLFITLLLTSCAWLFNKPPVANIFVSTAGDEAPLVVNFDATNSYDPDGTITGYQWEFGDGNIDYGATVSNTYNDDGDYLAALTVSDESGATGYDSVTITVTNPAPVAAFTYTPINPVVGEEILFNASGSFDPAGLTAPETVTSFEWNFGDGETGYRMITYHTYSESGVFQVTLTISDDDGAIDTSMKEIGVGSTVEYYRPTFYWRWNNIDWRWEIPIPKYLYQYFNTKPRPQCFPLPDNCDYGEFVLNPDDNSTIESLAAELSNGIYNYFDKLENALYFIQAGIRYDRWESPPEWFKCPNCPSPITQRMSCDKMCYLDPGTGEEECGCEWPRYPIETLATGYGDCEDTAILFASLIRTLGYGAWLAEVPGHMAGLAPLDSGWVEANRDWLENRCEQLGLYFNDFLDPENLNKSWLWAETSVDGMYIPLGCYTEDLNVIDSWDVSSKTWIRLTANQK